MKIAFTSDEKRGLESTMSYHFGHCPYFVIVDIEGNKVSKVESIENPLAESHNPGELPGFMKDLGVEVIATGGMGPRAQEFFKQFGIKPIIGVYGKVKDVLEELVGEKIEFDENMEISDETGHSHEHIPIDNVEDEIRRLKMEVAELRKEIAELKSLLKNR